MVNCHCGIRHEPPECPTDLDELDAEAERTRKPKTKKECLALFTGDQIWDEHGQVRDTPEGRAYAAAEW